MEALTDLDFTVPRSCWSCHKKKVKCDRDQPCSTCVKSGARCSYPAPDQRKKSRRVPVNALLNRLAQLEQKVSTLSKPEHRAKVDDARGKSTKRIEDSAQELQHELPQSNTHQSTSDGTAGVLLNQGGESRYFGDSFIASLARDAKEFSPGADAVVLNGESVPEAIVSDAPSGIQPFPVSQPLPLDPRSGWRALRLWQIYLSNVEPLLKMLHIPTTQDKIYGAMQNSQGVEETHSMLLNAICFAALVSLDEEEAKNTFNVDLAFLMQQYRTETEKYISKFSLMTAPNLEYLQALTIFITSLRVVDNTRAVWILTGLAIRIAQSLGIHMDGQAFQISPFDCEIRRRVWWHIFLLEIRAAEDHGLLVSDFTTSKHPPLYPSNINDEDIWPGMMTAPTPATTGTSSTLTIIRIQLADQIIQLGLYPGNATDKLALLGSIDEARKKVKIAYEKIATEWLSTAEQKMQNYYAGAAALLDFSYKKAEFLIGFRAYQSPLLDDQAKELIRAETVENALALMESINTIETSISLKRFHWYSKSNPQWFTVGFVLQQLYRGLIRDSDLRQRAQSAIEEVFALGSRYHRSSVMQRRSAIWVALQLLKDKALAKYPAKSLQMPAAELSTNSGTDDLTTPESTDLDALDSMFNFNDFDFSQLGPTDFSIFDGQIPMDITGFDETRL